MDYKKTNAPTTTTVHDLIAMAKPTLIATQEYIDGKLAYRNVAKEKDEFNF